MLEYDLIEIVSIILVFLLGGIALLSFRNLGLIVSGLFILIMIIPLLWAGLLRLPVPQTLIWLGMNISAIVFCWQGLAGLMFGHDKSSLLPLPEQLGKTGRHLASLVLGALFALLIVLTQI